MGYKSDFNNADGWSAVDASVKLNTSKGRRFRDFLKAKSVGTIVRYYASSRRAKTLSKAEASELSSDGFAILPVYQDRNRKPADFGADNGKRHALNAIEFAEYIGQPEGSTILFAVDADFSNAKIRQHIVPYFEAIRDEIDGDFRIGAYGGGAVLRTLLNEGLIEVPWISMSRLFNGTKDFFYSRDWAFRQVPPDRTHSPSGVRYDRNVLNWEADELGSFRFDEDGVGVVIGSTVDDATLGGGMDSGGAPAEDGGATGAEDINAYVATEGLNFRVRPNGEIIRGLTIGTPVQDLGAAGTTNWRRVDIDGDQGVVFGKYLRAPSTPEIESLLQSTIQEWVRFDKGRAHEEADPHFEYVGEMWQSIGLNYDGRSRYPDGREVPWSAAFISFVVRRAGGAYSEFEFAAAHSKFSHDAIQARILDNRSKPFWGFRRTEQRPVIGDIIHRNRGGGSFTFDYAENHSGFASHADVVVEVTSHVARVIGGNVGDTVSMERRLASGNDIQEYKLDDDGFLRSGQRIIALLKNRANAVE